MILLSSTLLTAVLTSLLFLFILNALTLLIYYFDTFSCPPTFRMSQDLIVVSQTSEQVYVKLTITSSGKSSQCTSHDDKKLIFEFIYSKPVKCGYRFVFAWYLYFVILFQLTHFTIYYVFAYTLKNNESLLFCLYA